MSATGPKGRELYFDPRQLRNAWFAELSRAMDAYMRSAAFLEWMRYALTVMTEAQALQAKSLASMLGKSGHEPARNHRG